MSQSASSAVYYGLFANCSSAEDCAWKALTEACTRLHVQAGTFFEVDKEKQHLKVATTYGVLPWRVAKGEFPIAQGICGWVAQHQEPALVNEVSNDPRFNSQIDLITQFKTVSVLCAPIVADGQILGVLELINRHEQPFTPDDLKLLQNLIQPAASRMKELSQ